jgi:hypothetical protein
MTAAKIQRTLDWMVKVATVVITIPATLQVAGEAFAAVPSWGRWILQIAAVTAVDATWLLAWFALDQRKSDAASDKLGNALIVAVMYAATLAIAIQHGEGAAGIVFRLAIGLAVARSVWSTFAHSLRKFRMSDWRVSRWEFQRNRKIARARIDREIAIGVARETAQQVAGLAAIQAQKRQFAAVAQRETQAIIAAMAQQTAKQNGGNRAPKLGATFEQMSARRWRFSCECGYVSDAKYASKRAATNAHNAHVCDAVLVAANGR